MAIRPRGTAVRFQLVDQIIILKEIIETRSVHALTFFDRFNSSADYFFGE
jgi:hypothetical protein